MNTPAPLDRIRRAGRRLRLAACFLIAPVLLAPPLWWLLAAAPTASLGLSFGVPIPDDPSTVQRLLAGAVGLLPAGFVAGALWTLARLFRRFEDGDVFGPGTEVAFRGLGRILIGWSCAGVVHGTLLGLVLTMDNPVGQRALSIGFDGLNVTALCVGVVAWLLSWVFAEARRIADDNAQFV